MSAFITKDEMSLLMPHNATYRSTAEEAMRVAAEARLESGQALGQSLARGIVRAVAYLRALPQRRATMNELRGLSERELADIGLSRSDLPRVFDPAFASECGARRGPVGQFSNGRSAGLIARLPPAIATDAPLMQAARPPLPGPPA